MFLFYTIPKGNQTRCRYRLPYTSESDTCLEMRIRGAIVGAGIIGSAVACELSQRGITDLHVIDPDLEGSLSSTERNAGGVRHLWQHPVNIELSRISISFFEKISKEIGFRQTGYLWLFAKKKADQAPSLLEHAKRFSLPYQQWSVADIKRKYPFIDKTDDLSFGLFGHKDGLVNSNALKNYYRDQAKQRGVRFHDRIWMKDLKEKSGKVSLTLTSLKSEDQATSLLKHPSSPQDKEEIWTCDFVVLCAGPWMKAVLSSLIGNSLVQPIRRQICVFSAENFDMTPYGMVVDTSRAYFHPEGGNILAGLVLKDEPEGYRFDYDVNFFESHIWPALYERSSHLERLKHLTGWAGLYSYTPDTTGILGKLHGFQNVYEAHSFTGRGIMQSHGAAVALAELVLKGRFETLDARELSRERFGTSLLLHEELHI